MIQKIINDYLLKKQEERSKRERSASGRPQALAGATATSI